MNRLIIASMALLLIGSSPSAFGKRRTKEDPKIDYMNVHQSAIYHNRNCFIETDFKTQNLDQPKAFLESNKDCKVKDDFKFRMITDKTLTITCKRGDDYKFFPTVEECQMEKARH